MAGAFDSRSYAALEFQAVARDAPREQFALFVDKLEQKNIVFVINVTDAEFAKTAVFFAFQPDSRIAEEFDIFSGSSHIIMDWEFLCEKKMDV